MATAIPSAEDLARVWSLYDRDSEANQKLQRKEGRFNTKIDKELKARKEARIAFLAAKEKAEREAYEAKINRRLNPRKKFVVDSEF